MDDIIDGTSEVSCDVLVIGGGTAGPMAALKAKLKNPKATRASCWRRPTSSAPAPSRWAWTGSTTPSSPATRRRSSTPRKSPSPTTASSTRRPVYKYAQRCYAIIEELDSFGIRFQKNENGDFAVKKVHHIGTYVLPMPNGDTVKKALYRQLRRARLLISNRYMATRLLTGERRPRSPARSPSTPAPPNSW